MNNYRKNSPLNNNLHLAHEIDENEPHGGPGGTSGGDGGFQLDDGLGGLIVGGLIAGGVAAISHILNGNNSEDVEEGGEVDCSQQISRIENLVSSLEQGFDGLIEEAEQSCLDSKQDVINLANQLRQEFVSIKNQSNFNDCDPNKFSDIQTNMRSRWEEISLEIEQMKESGCCTFDHLSQEQQDALRSELGTRANSFVGTLLALINNSENTLGLSEVVEPERRDNPMGLLDHEEEILTNYVMEVVEGGYTEKGEFFGWIGSIEGCTKTFDEIWTSFQLELSEFEAIHLIQFSRKALEVRATTMEELDEEEAGRGLGDEVLDWGLGVFGVIGSVAMIFWKKNPLKLDKFPKMFKDNKDEIFSVGKGAILVFSGMAMQKSIDGILFKTPQEARNKLDELMTWFSTNGEVSDRVANQVQEEVTVILQQRLAEIDSQELTTEQRNVALQNLFSDITKEIIDRLAEGIQGLDGYVSIVDPADDRQGPVPAGLPVPKQFNLPIALESVDCIGEQCEAFPRLRYRVRVIQPGRSLNNYEYSPQMLRRSARLLEGVPVQAYGFGQYQPMFSHLPAELEPMQPSGFALNRVGLLKDAAYENHPDFGEGLFATLVVDKAAEGWAKAILDEATTPGGNGTGVSIFADIDGDYGYDDLSDEMYVKVNAIKNFRSVDLASQPAAGGAIVAAIEDAGSQQREYLNALKEAIKALTVEEILMARLGHTH